jgi:hypothetical protein
MKLRLEQNSVRLRLSDAEVAQFAETGQVAYTIAFGPSAAQVLRYSLERQPAQLDAAAVQVRYEAGVLAVEVPASLAHEWTSTEKIGFSAQILVADGQQLRILVEKDLDCKH